MGNIHAQTPTTKTNLRLVGVTRAYEPNVVALANVTLTVPTGQRVAVLGPSGSGKSTLLGILGLMDAPSAGEYFVGGTNTRQLPERHITELRASVFGFVFQAFHLVAHLSARENVEIGLTLAGVPASKRRRLAEASLTAVGLGERADFRPSQLSGGEQQRVAIARALARQPQVLLCDEPTGNLDSGNAERVLDILFDGDARTRTTLVVTHNEKVADRCDRVIRFLDGTIVSDVTVRASP